MELNPQFNYDKHGKLIGVFLTAEDWETIVPNLKVDVSPEEKSFIDERLKAYYENPSAAIDAEDFFKQLHMEDEAL